MFDFDEIRAWGPLLRRTVGRELVARFTEELRREAPEYVEDARDIVLNVVSDRRAFLMNVEGWLQQQTVAAFHGSRLTPLEIESIRAVGLRVLRASDREHRLEEVLAPHSDWPAVRHKLPDALRLFGPGNHLGHREGQAHATLSRSGLINEFSHYLTHGSEFDQHVARHLLGDEAEPLLAAYGEPTLVHLAVPGQAALAACNHFGVPDIPNMVSHVLSAWCFWLADPTFDSASLGVDCGLFFEEDIPSTWIVGTTRCSV